MAVIRAPVAYPTGGSALADMLKGAGFGISQYGRDLVTEQDRARRIRAEEEARETASYQAQIEAAQSQAEAAKVLSEEELAKLHPAAPETMQVPDPVTGAMTDVQKSAAPMILDPETGTFKVPAAEATAAVPIPEHLGGGERPGLALQSREDLQRQRIGEATEAMKAEREARRELGDYITITPEHISGVPEGYRGLLEQYVGQEMETKDWNGIVTQMGLGQLRVQEQLAAEERREGRAIAREERSYQRQLDLLNERARLKGLSGQLTPQQLDRISRITVSDWRDFTARHANREDFSTRSGLRRADALAVADELGLTLPGRKVGEATLKAKAELADIDALKEYLDDPEVTEWLGAYAGRITDWSSKGWLEPLKGWLGGLPDIPNKVYDFRATLNQIAAAKRHEIYGAAVTETEIPFAESFIPRISQGMPAMEAAIRELEDNIVRGLDATWGIGGGRVPVDPDRGTTVGGETEAGGWIETEPGVRVREVGPGTGGTTTTAPAAPLTVPGLPNVTVDRSSFPGG
jgi:hypothetical protein